MEAKKYKEMARRGATETVFKLKTRSAKKGHITDVCRFVEARSTQGGFRVRDVIVSIKNTGEGWELLVDRSPTGVLFATKAEASIGAFQLAKKMDIAGGVCAEEFVAGL